MEDELPQFNFSPNYPEYPLFYTEPPSTKPAIDCNLSHVFTRIPTEIWPRLLPQRTRFLAWWSLLSTCWKLREILKPLLYWLRKEDFVELFKEGFFYYESCYAVAVTRESLGFYSISNYKFIEETFSHQWDVKILHIDAGFSVEIDCRVLNKTPSIYFEKPFLSFPFVGNDFLRSDRLDIAITRKTTPLREYEFIPSDQRHAIRKLASDLFRKIPKDSHYFKPILFQMEKILKVLEQKIASLKSRSFLPMTSSTIRQIMTNELILFAPGVDCLLEAC